VKLELSPLPYAEGALAPHLSARTLHEHYGSHHQGYLDKLAKLIRGKPEENLSLEELVRTSTGDVFDCAAQVWNHDLYWRSMRPGGGGSPGKALSTQLAERFGSVATCKQRLAEAANGRFGSGWAWLSLDAGGRLGIESSSNAENPLKDGGVPLLALDVWEHAYYLDYQGERDRYVRGFLDHLIDWKFVAETLESAQARREEAA
jgi:Fe-Mn family superoxide dismutase